MATPGDRLSQKRKESGFESAREAAVNCGWTVSTYTSHENGTRGIKLDAAERYARRYKTTAAWLLTGEGPEKISTVPLVGYIGAGQAIHFIDDHAQGAGYDDVEAPEDVGPNTVAVQVRGDSMFPTITEGALIYYDEHIHPDELLNNLAVVRLEDDRTLVKLLRKGTEPGFYTLHSSNAVPIEDVAVRWAAKIKWIKLP